MVEDLTAVSISPGRLARLACSLARHEDGPGDLHARILRVEAKRQRASRAHKPHRGRAIRQRRLPH